jgi:hypothetical protein
VSIGRRSVGHTSWMRMYGEPAPAPNAVVRPGSGCQNLLAVNGGHTPSVYDFGICGSSDGRDYDFVLNAQVLKEP